MSDGYGNGPWQPISDADLLGHQDVGDILGLLPSPFRGQLERHIVALTRRKPLITMHAALAAYHAATINDPEDRPSDQGVRAVLKAAGVTVL